MDEFIERFKKWLDSQKELGEIDDWSLVEGGSGWTVGLEADETEFFVSIEPA